MAFEPLNFTKNWENPEDFPTYEPDETRVRADLQLLHDETCAALNRLIAALNDPSAAAQLPFLPQDGLTAQTVQAAVEEVYAAVQNAAAGKLVDGTVTKEKLAQSLLERVYGGKVWVSADTPSAAQNPDGEFPVGQLWLRPDFAVENLAEESWLTSGCTMEADGGRWLLTTDGTWPSASAEQLLEQVGQAGQTVLVRLTVEAVNDHLTDLTLTLNGVEQELTVGSGLYETALDQTGSLELKLEGVWPYAESGAEVRLADFAVINLDAAALAYPGCRLPADWAAFLDQGLSVERTLFQQTAPGRWIPVDQAVLPVVRGGTGRTGFDPGLLLYADKNGKLVQLPAPETADSLLRFSDGEPKWLTHDALRESMGALRCKSGDYTGTGADRELDLGCEPKILFLRQVDDDVNTGNGASIQEKLQMFPGEHIYRVSTITYTFNGTERDVRCYNHLELSGNLLKSRSTYQNQSYTEDNYYFNHAGVAYQWLAIY